MGKLCKDLGIAKLLEDKKKAGHFISAVNYIGFRSLSITPPRSAQWNFALQILTSYYYMIFEERPLHQLIDAAQYIASLHNIYHQRVIREEERTAAFLAESEARRGTFYPAETLPI
ncbi:hypothetical protein ACJMK2_004605 [Sinanodonta woodiana]|uniref:Uncharacterized protein n=1 Tax=Sinanodonta woodiana TaxID=1069815 RepID=A0ABD3Y2Y3_SINWO